MLGRTGINIYALASGACEKNITCMIPSACTRRAVQAVHEHFFGAAGPRPAKRQRVACGDVVAAATPEARLAALAAALGCEAKAEAIDAALASVRQGAPAP